MYFSLEAIILKPIKINSATKEARNTFILNFLFVGNEKNKNKEISKIRLKYCEAILYSFLKIFYKKLCVLKQQKIRLLITWTSNIITSTINIPTLRIIRDYSKTTR